MDEWRGLVGIIFCQVHLYDVIRLNFSLNKCLVAIFRLHSSLFKPFYLSFSNPTPKLPPNQTHKRHSRFRIGSHPPGMALTKLTNLTTGQGENTKSTSSLLECITIWVQKHGSCMKNLCQKRNIGAQNTFKWVLICLIRTLLNFSCVGL